MKHKFLNRIKQVVFILFFLSFINSAWAASSPVPMLQKTSDQLLSALKQHRAEIRHNPKVINSLVRRIVLPHVDMTTMSRSVLGPEAWRNANAQQRQRFTQEFINLVIHTYSGALSAYNDQMVKFKPLREGINSDRLQVESVVNQQDGPAISVNYRVRLDGDWKVYDFSVDGISMIESFRSQFANALSSGNIDQLIQSLSHHNGN